MAEEKETARKRRAPGGRKAANGLANGSVKNGRGAGKPAPKPHAKGAVSLIANKKRPPYAITDAARALVREMPVLSVLAAFAAGIIIGFRPGRR